ncbi:hypothetical protein SGRA_4163 [Saprospira grandis str. Lewin]|uniref:Uncharacterized protein n=1 Tax=Saprospira grandis (strain Lewin) TaxID=984262 RepID=H6L8S2_SAPGL|nr:hypothetical protein SGRA_4163 [Saprospira grandis str. Lewin]
MKKSIHRHQASFFQEEFLSLFLTQLLIESRYLKGGFKGRRKKPREKLRLCGLAMRRGGRRPDQVF